MRRTVYVIQEEESARPPGSDCTKQPRTNLDRADRRVEDQADDEAIEADDLAVRFRRGSGDSQRDS
jgi:hypothetical protein